MFGQVDPGVPWECRNNRKKNGAARGRPPRDRAVCAVFAVTPAAKPPRVKTNNSATRAHRHVARRSQSSRAVRATHSVSCRLCRPWPTARPRAWAPRQPHHSSHPPPPLPKDVLERLTAVGPGAGG